MIVRLAIVLIAAAGVLAGAHAYHLGRQPLPALPAGSSLSDPDSAAAKPATRAPALQARIEDLVGRPPFSPDRRPEVPRAPDAAPSSPASGAAAALAATLLGVIQDGGERFAVLSIGPARVTAIVRRGGQIEGWTVEIIDDKRVVLRKGSDEAELLLFESK